MITVLDLNIPNKECPAVLDMWSAHQHRRYHTHKSVIVAWEFYSCYFCLIQDSIKVLGLKLQLGELGCKEVEVMEEAVGIQKREGG